MTQTDAVLPTEPLAEPGEAPSPAPPPTRRGPLALLGGLLIQPRATFAYLRDYGRAAWVWPLAAALLLTLTARLIAVPLERAQAQAALEALQQQLQDQVPADEGDVVTFGSAVPFNGPMFATGPAGGAASEALANYGLPLLGVLGQWLVAGVALLALAWVLGGRPRPGSLLRMSAWAVLVPVAARSLVAIAVMLATGRVPLPGLTAQPAGSGPVISTVDSEDLPAAEAGAPVMIGPAGMAGPSGLGQIFLGALRGSFASSLDVYTVWGLVLLIVGVAVTARFGWLRATAATAAYWGFSLALSALPPVVTFWMMSLSGAASFVPVP